MIGVHRKFSEKAEKNQNGIEHVPQPDHTLTVHLSYPVRPHIDSTALVPWQTTHWQYSSRTLTDHTLTVQLLYPDRPHIDSTALVPWQTTHWQYSSRTLTDHTLTVQLSYPDRPHTDSPFFPVPVSLLCCPLAVCLWCKPPTSFNN